MHHNILSCDFSGTEFGCSFLNKQILTHSNQAEDAGARLPRKRHLVKTNANLILSCALLVAMLLSSNCLVPIESVIMPPHRSLYKMNHRENNNSIHLQPSNVVKSAAEQIANSQDNLNLMKVKDTPYMLTISDADSINVSVNGKSSITINLNRAIPESVSVLMSINSGPDLIIFDNTTSNSNGAGEKKNEFTVEYAANTFGDRVVNFHTNDLAGHAEIVCHVVKQPESKIIIDDKQAFISVNTYRNWNLNIIIQIVGWVYFFAWSISFYFQVILNYQRKSVVGLNFDFLILNLLGFTCYSIYNCSLLFSYTIQQEYYKRYTYSRIPVEYNDLFFALHAFAITLVTVVQCSIYERGDQQISLPTGIFVSLAPALGFILYITSTLFHSLSILDVVLYLSYVKLIITLIKYSPQAYMNYKRKATTGWSIHNIILDFTGGLFSLIQMLLIAYNYNDWISIFGNATKLGLGLFSMAFDILFLFQHYVLYKSSGQQLLEGDNDFENSSDSVPSPIISRSANLSNNNNNNQNNNQTATSNNDHDTNGESDYTD